MRPIEEPRLSDRLLGTGLENGERKPMPFMLVPENPGHEAPAIFLTHSSG